jgi:hypothetical protein
MAYSSGGLIAATDYNTFVGTSPSAVSNTLNTVWAVGNGQYGYGQTAVAQISSTNTVTAAQWSSLINSMNSIRVHQTGTGTGVLAVTAGATITYTAAISTSLASAYTGALTAATRSAVSTAVGGTFTTAWTNISTSATLARSIGLKATFASADQARYFFNAGGQIKYNVSAAQNASTTARTNEIIALTGTLGGIATFGSTTSGGRTGTGGTLGTNNTAIGYYGTTTANVALVATTSTTANYTSDTGSIFVLANGVQGANADKGTVVTFWTNVSSLSGTNGPGGTYSFDDAIGVNFNQTIDVTYPEVTNLANSWGTITVALA